MNQVANIIPQESLNLPRNLQEIISQIQNLVGEVVIFRSDISNNYEGASLIRDGVPTVYLSQEGRRPITICHELLHLICETQGYPRTKTLKDHGKYQISLIKFTLEFLQATIEHQVIYPRMLDLGYDPYAELETKTRKGILSNLSKNPYEKVDETKLRHQFQWLHDILRPFAELDTKDIHEEIKKKTKEKCPIALNKAEKIAMLIRKQTKWDQTICKTVLTESICVSGIPEGTYEICP